MSEPVCPQIQGLTRFGSHVLIFRHLDPVLPVLLQRMLGSTVCAGGRLALRTSSSRYAFCTLTDVCSPSLQSFRLGLPYSPSGSAGSVPGMSFHPPRVTAPLTMMQHLQGPLGNLPSRQGFSNARNYWWSKPATSEVVNTPSQHTPEPVAQAKSATPEEAVAATDVPSIAQTESVVPTSTPTSEPLSEVLSADVSAPASALSEVVTSAIPPLQYGDFAALGITSWWPSGIMTWSFELLQVSTGMPWFYTIIAGTLFWRAILIPSALTSMRNSARLRPYTEQIKTLDEQAQAVKDRAAQMEIMLKKQKLMEKAGVSIQSMFLPPLIQMVGNFGLFFAIKGMVQLPVMQLAQSGVWFLPDLTLTGDYVMPTLVLLAMNAQFSVSIPP